MPEVDVPGVLQSLTAIGAKLAYSVILAAIALLCVSELVKVWADRSQVLAAFEYNKDGSLLDAEGKAFSNRLLQQQRLVRGMFQPPVEGDGLLTAEASIEFRDLRVLELNSSQLDELQIEAQGLKITDLLSRLRNWIRQPNEIRGRIDQVGDEYHVFAEWRTRPAGAGERAAFYSQVHDDLQEASFDLAARLLWQQVIELQSPESKLIGSLVPDFTGDRFAAFMHAWATYQRHKEAAARPGATRPETADLDAAIRTVDALLQGETRFPPVYNLAANLRLLRTPLEQMAVAEKRAVRDLLAAYLERLQNLKLQEDEDARKKLAAIEVGDEAATRIAQATRASRAAPERAGREAPRRVALAGASIGPMGVETAGSACCVVRDPAGTRYLVTADYLFGQGGEVVLSPASIDGGKESDRIGQLDRRVPESGPRIALIRLDEDVEAANEIPEVGAFGALADVPAPGGAVLLFGRSSELRRGTVLDAAAPMPGLVALERLSQPGDGGAPILDDAGRLVGLVYAGSDKITGALPLKSLFETLGLSLVTDAAAPEPTSDPTE